ncbi:MAG: YCF48-related protein [candidate division WOR-3 bacterium]
MKIKYMALFLILCNVLFAYQNFHGCCLAPDNQTGWVVTLDSIIVLKTTDGGAHWFEQSNNAAARKFFDITCRDNLKAWTCGILGEITHTNNGGQTWTHQVQGLAKYATRIEFIDDTLGWVVCGDGVVGRTTDGGAYWEQIFTPWAQAEFYGVSFANAYEGWVVSGWPDSLDTGQGLIIHTTDGGFNWNLQYFSSVYEDFFDVHFFNVNIGIVVGGNEQNYSPIIWKTIDGGYIWTPITAPANAYYLRALDFVDTLNGWAVGRFGTIINTTDGGNTWNFQTNPATTTLFDVDFSDTQHGIACGQGIILYTTNGGNTWNTGTGIEESTNSQSTIRNPKLSVYPNPFKNHCLIKFQIPSTKSQILNNSELRNPKSEISSKILNVGQGFSLAIYDVSGRAVKSFNPESCILNHASGIIWSGDDDLGRKLPAGVYLIRLETDDYTKVEKTILLR